MPDVRSDFPYLDRQRSGRPVVYLDSAATTQKPRPVIQELQRLYSNGIANVHRAGLDFTGMATELSERWNTLVRSVVHCAQPTHDKLGIGPTVQTSTAVYGANDRICHVIEVLPLITRVVP